MIGDSLSSFLHVDVLGSRMIGMQAPRLKQVDPEAYLDMMQLYLRLSTFLGRQTLKMMKYHDLVLGQISHIV